MSLTSLTEFPLEILLKICDFLVVPWVLPGFYYHESAYEQQTKQSNAPSQGRLNLEECWALYSSCRVLRSLLGRFMNETLDLGMLSVKYPSVRFKSDGEVIRV